MMPPVDFCSLRGCSKFFSIRGCYVLSYVYKFGDVVRWLYRVRLSIDAESVVLFIMEALCVFGVGSRGRTGMGDKAASGISSRKELLGTRACSHKCT